MVRKLFLMVVGVCLIALVFLGIRDSINKNSEVQKVVGELNNLSKITIEQIGEEPTKDSIANAGKYLDENKPSVVKNLQILRDKGLIKSGIEPDTVLEKTKEAYRTQFALIYDKLTQRSDEEIEQLNRLMGDLGEAPLNSKKYRKLEKDLIEHSKKMRGTAALMSAMDTLVNKYMTIFQ